MAIQMNHHDGYYDKSRNPMHVQPEEPARSQSGGIKRTLAYVETDEEHEPRREGRERYHQENPILEQM